MSSVYEVDLRIRHMAVLHPDFNPNPETVQDFFSRYTRTRKKVGLDELAPGQSIKCSQVDSYLAAIEKARESGYKYNSMLGLALRDAVLAHHQSSCPTGVHPAGTNMHLFASRLTDLLNMNIVPLLR